MNSEIEKVSQNAIDFSWQKYMTKLMLEALEKNKVIIWTDECMIEIEAVALDEFLSDAKGRQATMIMDKEDFEKMKRIVE